MRQPVSDKVKRFKRNEAGASAVEMALVLPAFLLFVLGLFEFCRAFWTLNSMQLAIDEAGRYAMVNIAASDSKIISTATANLYGLDSSKFTVTSTAQTTNGVNYKVISASYVFSFVSPGVLPYGSFTMTRSTTVPLIP